MAGQVLGKVTAGGGTHLISNTFYGTCTASASSATKGVRLNDVDIDSISLIPGMLLTVRFSYTNSANNPVLVIYNKLGGILADSKPIKKYGTTSAGVGLDSWMDGAVVAFVYDGTNWVEVSSASGGTEEVSIGSTEPTDDNIKIWIRV